MGCIIYIYNQESVCEPIPNGLKRIRAQRVGSDGHTTASVRLRNSGLENMFC